MRLPLLLPCLLLPFIAAAQPGLSPAHVFNIDPGIVTSHNAKRITVDPAGNVVIFGVKYATIPYDSRVIYLRALPDATPDSTFDGEGWVEHNICTQWETAVDLQALPDGKVMGMGLEDYPDYDNDGIYVQKLNVDGSPDTSFWGNGKFIFQLNGETTFPRAMALQPDSGVVIMGQALGSVYDAFIIRLAPDGSFDTSFGLNGGAYIGMVNGEFDDPADLCVLPDGSMIVAGAWKPMPNAYNGLYMQHILADGTVDASYGNGGITQLHDTSFFQWPSRVALASDGSVYVLSELVAMPANISQLVVQHFLADGTYDLAFGTNGIATLQLVTLPGNKRPAGLVVLPNDLIAVNAKVEEAGLMLLLPNGQPAAGFGTNGVLYDPLFLYGQNQNIDMAGDADGNVWVLTHRLMGNSSSITAYKVIIDLSVGTLDAPQNLQAPMLLGTVVREDRVELAWRMQQAGPLNVDLLSSDGRVLRTLWSAALGAGEHRQQFALPAGLASGAYLLRFTTQQGVATVRFLRQ